MRNFASQVTSSVTTINLSILFAALGIALAVVTEHLAERPETPELTHAITSLFLWITIIYALCLGIVQFLAVLKEHKKAPGVLRSTFTGIFILLTLLVLIEDNTDGFWLLLGGFVVCIVAFIALSNVTETTVTVSGGNASSSLPRYTPFAPTEEEIATNKAHFTMLAGEFEKDQLYMSPQSKGNSSFRYFSLGRGPTVLENDDACFVSDKVGRYALCDGASGSKYARAWGALLSKKWCEDPPRKNDPITVKWLQGPLQEWKEWVNRTLKPRLNKFAKDARNTIDDIDTVLQLGAATTFLGLSFDKNKDEWHATALGNTCLFIFSNNRYRNHFVSPAATDANGKPVLMNSNDKDLDQLADKFEMGQGKISQGDIVILATQPLARWIFPPEQGKRKSAEQESDWQKRIAALLTMNTQEEFSNFVRLIRPAQKNGTSAEDYSMLRIAYR